MTLEEVFTFGNLMKAANKCLLGVRWKASTQNFERNKLLEVVKHKEQILNQTYKAKPFKEFTISERGKTRHIKSLHITDRMVQKCYCDNFLTPLLTSKLIYDNCACIKGRGVTFARKRIKIHLLNFTKENKDGYVLSFDFKKYFDSIPHDILLSKLRTLIKDDRLFNMIKEWIKSFGDRGLGLGSQISQICATYYANELDQFIKHKLRIKGYIRYMDDCIILHKDKEYLKYCLKEITKVLDNLGLELNTNKTQIIKLSKGFTFLKRNYLIRDNIIQIPHKSSFKRMLGKIKSIKDNIRLQESFSAWKSSLIGTNCYNKLQRVAI